MLNFIDNFLNKITMYRLVLYVLTGLILVALIFGAFHLLPYSPTALLFSTIVLIAVCWTVNTLCAALWKAHPNVESVYITAMILALIITPVLPSQTAGVLFLVLAGAVAMLSKYLFALRKKHFFNPAAFAVAVTAITISQYASWWVGGNLPLLAFVLIGGFLIVRKIQRFDLVFAFLAAACVSYLVTIAGGAGHTLEAAALHTPIFFFAAIMLTEPLTTPPTRPLRILYGVLVGLLFSPAVHIGSIYSTPELALLVGNIFSYIVSPKEKYVLSLVEKKEVGTGIYDFAFAGAGATTATSKTKLKFEPGQYLEWTLSHAPSDDRGNRRYFTIASSPTEKLVHLGARFYEPSSSFKKKMLAMQPGDTILAGQRAGDFTLPSDASRKLVFLAGGIGITPFRSMVKYLTDKQEKRDVILLYSNRTAEEIAYKEIFDEAQAKIGLKVCYTITDSDNIPAGDDYRQGMITAEFLRKEVPDHKERFFYISGTHAMVQALKAALQELNVPAAHIKTDFFPGFV